MSRFAVLLTDDATHDLEDICEYIARRDGVERAAAVLEKFEAVFEALATSPERGTRPKELTVVGIREFRQTYFKPYRIIYRVLDEAVYVLVIADGRRDMRSLLERRLLGAD